MSSIEQAGLVESKQGARGARAAAAVAKPRALTHHRAPFSLRCGALLIDYTLVASVVAFSTLLARLFSTRSAADTAITIGYVLAVSFAALNFLLLPAFTGRTAGKWATGLRVECRDGEPLGFGRAFLRHTVGYLASLVTLGVGFLLAALNREGRALHDIVAGTVVVRE
ncbi:MAG TPA: RDD family protein [Pyrinomonadaceae bacterium]|jgi:uncharacterized RDD family membrane protein YckC|nr:RDD family protein [Pyrinomonadaceae bacterium]